jgi:hypothetical protein
VRRRPSSRIALLLIGATHHGLAPVQFAGAWGGCRWCSAHSSPTCVDRFGNHRQRPAQGHPAQSAVHRMGAIRTDDGPKVRSKMLRLPLAVMTRWRYVGSICTRTIVARLALCLGRIQTDQVGNLQKFFATDNYHLKADAWIKAVLTVVFSTDHMIDIESEIIEYFQTHLR